MIDFFIDFSCENLNFSLSPKISGMQGTSVVERYCSTGVYEPAKSGRLISVVTASVQRKNSYGLEFAEMLTNEQKANRKRISRYFKSFKVFKVVK